MSAITAPIRAAWGWFKLAVIIGAVFLALVTGWTVDDARAVGGHLWAICEILWEGLVNIWSTGADAL